MAIAAHSIARGVPAFGADALSLDFCGIGSWGGQRSLAPYVRGMGAARRASAQRHRRALMSFTLTVPSLSPRRSVPPPQPGASDQIAFASQP